jgi:hypothetical protein
VTGVTPAANSRSNTGQNDIPYKTMRTSVIQQFY